jgi:hypothetical protein
VTGSVSPVVVVVSGTLVVGAGPVVVGAGAVVVGAGTVVVDSGTVVVGAGAVVVVSATVVTGVAWPQLLLVTSRHVWLFDWLYSTPSNQGRTRSEPENPQLASPSPFSSTASSKCR